MLELNLVVTKEEFELIEQGLLEIQYIFSSLGKLQKATEVSTLLGKLREMEKSTK